MALLSWYRRRVRIAITYLYGQGNRLFCLTGNDAQVLAGCRVTVLDGNGVQLG